MRWAICDSFVDGGAGHDAGNARGRARRNDTRVVPYAEVAVPRGSRDGLATTWAPCAARRGGRTPVARAAVLGDRAVRGVAATKGRAGRARRNDTRVVPYEGVAVPRGSRDGLATTWAPCAARRGGRTPVARAAVLGDRAVRGVAATKGRAGPCAAERHTGRSLRGARVEAPGEGRSPPYTEIAGGLGGSERFCGWEFETP
jgi:hypothetical protein